MDDILQGADALRGSFYHFFPTKADLILECLERIWSSQSEGLRAVYELASTPEEGLEQHFAFLAKVQIDAQEAFGFVPGTFNMSMPTSLLREDTRISDKLRQLMDENRRYLERAIQRVKRKRQLTLSASAAARLLSYAWNGMVLAARMENSLTPLRDMKLVLKRVLEDPAAVG